MSGAGKSTAINALEDVGFFCVDNIPPALIPKFADFAAFGDRENAADSKTARGCAFGCDIRGGEMFSSAKDVIFELIQSGVKVKVLFMNASDEVIKRRYKETRRIHPLFQNHQGSQSGVSGSNIGEAIAAERATLAPIMEIADYEIDTSMMGTAAIKESVLNLFMEKISDSMLIKCTSFGFKYAIPGDADLVFDVRYLPNPFYVPALKSKTGLDKPVRDFVMNEAVSAESESRFCSLIDFLVPHYIAEGKSQLVIAFGCTGGKHRSVTFAERMQAHLSKSGYRVMTFHRDIDN
jgi:UPF0042 nucleotide-binding protein